MQQNALAPAFLYLVIIIRFPSFTNLKLIAPFVGGVLIQMNHLIRGLTLINGKLPDLIGFASRIPTFNRLLFKETPQQLASITVHFISLGRRRLTKNKQTIFCPRESYVKDVQAFQVPLS